MSDRPIRLTDTAQAYAATYFRQPEPTKKNPKRVFIGAEDNGLFEKLLSEITAERVVVAHKLMTSVENFLDRFNALKRKKNSKNGLPDWKKAYQEVVGSKLVDQYSDVMDQVVPQSAIFLCALLFEDHVRIKKKMLKSY